jgi:SAM-dependent methyltransferase
MSYKTAVQLVKNARVHKHVFACILAITCVAVFGYRDWNRRDAGRAYDAFLTRGRHPQICRPLTDMAKHELANAVALYETDSRYEVKQAEARGERDLDTRAHACLRFLRERVLVKGQSVLDLGCAAGAALKHIQIILTELGGHGKLVGVELVPGWVQEARRLFEPSMSFYNADITEFNLDETFNVITLHDVIEHVQPERLFCLVHKLKKASRPGTAVYFHVPSPETQLADDGQFFENVLPFHILVDLMATAQFQLEYFSYDTYTDCDRHGGVSGFSTRNMNASCVVNGAPKYAHMLFRFTDQEQVFDLTRKCKTC